MITLKIIHQITKYELGIGTDLNEQNCNAILTEFLNSENLYKEKISV